MPQKVYHTKTGQPYIKLANGRARFIKKKGGKKKWKGLRNIKKRLTKIYEGRGVEIYER